jgi:hypothetical protein
MSVFGGSLAVYDLRYTITHEIGRAIGLDHPVPAGQLMPFRYQEQFRALQAGDIEGAVQLYGSKRVLTPAASKPVKLAGLQAHRAVKANPAISSSRVLLIAAATIAIVY